MNLNSKFIIDTNIFVSSLLIKNSTAFRAMEKARATGQLLFSDDTFLELELVLLRKKFDRYFSKEERLQLIERIHRECVFVPVVSNLQFCRDPKDDKFLNLAIAIEASHLITGDDDLLVLNPFYNTLILSPADFLNAL